MADGLGRARRRELVTLAHFSTFPRVDGATREIDVGNQAASRSGADRLCGMPPTSAEDRPRTCVETALTAGIRRRGQYLPAISRTSLEVIYEQG